MSVLNMLPAGGSVKADLLWTNPNPGSASGAFNVNIDLRNYTAIVVRMRDYNDGSNYEWTIALKGWGTQHLGVHTAERRLNGRRVTVTDSGASFSNGYVGASGNNSNNAGIPMKIYGIKLKGVSG